MDHFNYCQFGRSMIRSTPQKRPPIASGTPAKRKSVSASPSRRKNADVTPRKLARGGQSTQSTPTKSFALESLDDALSHYFSPKRRASKSPARRSAAQKRLDFADGNDAPDTDGGGSTEDDEPPADAPPPVAEALRCDLEALARCFDNIDAMLPEVFAERTAAFERQFDEWTALLRMERFSLLLHGVGSKRALLDRYAEMALAGRPHAIFYCYRAGVTVRHILDALAAELSLAVGHRGLSLPEWAGRLREAIEAADELPELFLLLHNIDAPCMRDPQQQIALATLAESRAIRLIATVDHKNATLLWDLETREKFNWLLVRAATLRTYGEALFGAELRSLGLSVRAGGRQHNVASLDVFWQANPENARKMLAHLAVHAGSAGGESGDEPLSLSKLCRILKQEFITNSEATLRAQLTEFVDSEIIRIDRDGTILLNVDRGLLVQFLETKGRTA